MKLFQVYILRAPTCMTTEINHLSFEKLLYTRPNFEIQHLPSLLKAEEFTENKTRYIDRPISLKAVEPFSINDYEP